MYEATARWADWQGWFESAYRDVTGLTFNRLMWRNLVAMLQANPAIEHHSHVNGYLTRSYAQMQAVGIRRQWDRDRRRPTIGRILHEMAKHPETATKESHVLAVGDEIQGRASWSRFAPEDKPYMDADQVQADLDRLVDETRAAREYVNDLVAHLDRDHRARAVEIEDWFSDLNRGIDVLAEMIKKYWPLFHPGDLLLQVTPLPDLQWISMFQTPWYSSGFVPVLPTDDDP